MKTTRVCMAILAAIGGLQVTLSNSLFAQAAAPPAALLGHDFTWNAEGAEGSPEVGMRFGADGLVKSSAGPQWKWRATGPRTVMIEGDASHAAFLTFDEEFKSFTGTGFDGKTKLRGGWKSAPLPATPAPRPTATAPTPTPAPNGIQIAGINDTRSSVMMATGGHSHELEDLGSLLAHYGTAGRDVGPHPKVMVCPGVPYLMPWREAEKILAPKYTDMKSGSKIACAGFPDGLTWVAYSGNWTVFNHSYNRLYIVKDIAHQVVCVEYLNQTQSWKQDWPELPGNWRVIDYVNAEVKGQSAIQICTQVLDQRKGQHRIVVHTTIVSGGRLDRGVTLFLPQPLINLMLTCVSAAK